MSIVWSWSFTVHEFRLLECISIRLVQNMLQQQVWRVLTSHVTCKVKGVVGSSSQKTNYGAVLWRLQMPTPSLFSLVLELIYIILRCLGSRQKVILDSFIPTKLSTGPHISIYPWSWSGITCSRNLSCCLEIDSPGRLPAKLDWKETRWLSLVTAQEAESRLL